MRSASKTLVAVKGSTNNLNADTMNNHLVDLCRRAIGKTLGRRGWSAKKPRIASEALAAGYIHTATIQFERSGQRKFTKESVDEQWTTISRKFASYGKSKGWSLGRGAPVVTQEVVVSVGRGKSKTLADAMTALGDKASSDKVPAQTKGYEREFGGADAIVFPDNWRSRFDHIYDRDYQISEVVQSILTAKETDMMVRNHVMMYGPPGCGKSEIGIALENTLGEQAVLKLDATSTTKAGAERLILERKPIPPIIVLEELEKCNEANLPWLLGIMDDRGEIIKTNAISGSKRKKAPCLVICTVNNLSKFEKFQEGALANRFNVPLYFAMPDRELLRKILVREVKKIPGGKESWVDPALEYALNVEKTYQARRIKAIMSNGRDRLLSGDYQKAQVTMQERRKSDEQKLKEFNVAF